MAAYVVGVWTGIRSTQALPGYNVDGGAFVSPRKTLGLPGVPAESFQIKLTFTSQSAYRKLSEDSVSMVSGELSFGDRKSAFTGFVNSDGIVQFIFYSGTDLSDSTFAGRLTTRGSMHDISGLLLGRRSTSAHTTGPEGWDRITHTFGALSVTKFAVNLRDRAYLTNILTRLFR